jgi:preprotein translocase subunit SecG
VEELKPLQIVCGAVLLLVNIIIIIICLMQDQKQQQNMTSAITGGINDSFYGKNEGRTKEAMLNKLTKVLTIIFFVLTLAVNVAPKFLSK